MAALLLGSSSLATPLLFYLPLCSLFAVVPGREAGPRAPQSPGHVSRASPPRETGDLNLGGREIRHGWRLPSSKCQISGLCSLSRAHEICSGSSSLGIWNATTYTSEPSRVTGAVYLHSGRRCCHDSSNWGVVSPFFFSPVPEGKQRCVQRTRARLRWTPGLMKDTGRVSVPGAEDSKVCMLWLDYRQGARKRNGLRYHLHLASAHRAIAVQGPTRPLSKAHSNPNKSYNVFKSYKLDKGPDGFLLFCHHCVIDHSTEGRTRIAHVAVGNMWGSAGTEFNLKHLSAQVTGNSSVSPWISFDTVSRTGWSQQLPNEFGHRSHTGVQDREGLYFRNEMPEKKSVHAYHTASTVSLSVTLTKGSRKEDSQPFARLLADSFREKSSWNGLRESRLAIPAGSMSPSDSDNRIPPAVRLSASHCRARKSSDERVANYHITAETIPVKSISSLLFAHHNNSRTTNHAESHFPISPVLNFTTQGHESHATRASQGDYAWRAEEVSAPHSQWTAPEANMLPKPPAILLSDSAHHVTSVYLKNTNSNNNNNHNNNENYGDENTIIHMSGESSDVDLTQVTSQPGVCAPSPRGPVPLVDGQAATSTDSSACSDRLNADGGATHSQLNSGKRVSLSEVGVSQPRVQLGVEAKEHERVRERQKAICVICLKDQNDTIF